MMQVCLLTQDQVMKDLMISELLFFGVTTVAAKDFQEADQIISEHHICCFILDIDGQEERALNYIEALKNDIKTSSLFILILTSANEDKLIHRYILEGVSGVCHKIRDIKSYIQSIQSIFIFLEQETDRRQYIRVQPVDDENLFIQFKMGSKTATGRIRDISAIAAAVVIQEKDFFNSISVEHQFKNVQFFIGKKNYSCDILIMRKSLELRRKEDILVVGYKEPDAEFKFGLASYLYQKIRLN